MTQDGECAIIFQGSQLTHGKQDWIDANTGLGANIIDDQYLAALRYYEKMAKKYNITHISGNSLAGGLVQFITLAYPEVIGRALNPSGINQAMLDYLEQEYGFEKGSLNNADLINFYTNTDILHRILDLEDENGIKEFSKNYPFLTQMGKQIFYDQSGSFDIGQMGVGHTGTDRITIYGPFDPLTGNFIMGDVINVGGFPHYITSPSKEIALNPEEIVEVACNLAKSLDAHDDEMCQKFNQIDGILQASVQDVAKQKYQTSNIIDDLLRNVGNPFIGAGVLAACNNQYLFKTLLSVVPPTMIAVLDVDALLESANVVWLCQRNLRAKFENSVTEFLKAATVTHRRTVVASDNGYMSTAGGSAMQHYFVNEYVEEALQNGLSVYLKGRVQEWAYTHEAIDYFSKLLMKTAEIFKGTDEALAEKIDATKTTVSRPSLNDTLNFSAIAN